MFDMPFPSDSSVPPTLEIDEDTILICEHCAGLIEPGGTIAVGMSFKVCPDHGGTVGEPELMFMHGDCFRIHAVENAAQLIG